MSETIRIGSPPTAPPARPDRTGLYAVLAGVVLLLAATGAVLGVVLGNRSQQASPQPSTSATERAPGSAIDELATCVAMIPLLRQSADEMNAFHGEPTRSASDMATTAAALRELEPNAPEAWRPDIAAQYSTLQKIVDAKGDPATLYQADLNLTEWADAGQRLAHGCLPYSVS